MQTGIHWHTCSCAKRGWWLWLQLPGFAAHRGGGPGQARSSCLGIPGWPGWGKPAPHIHTRIPKAHPSLSWQWKWL